MMTTAELRDNLITFLIAGHETTSTALSWALYLLAFAPKIQDRVRAEARQAMGGRRAATGEDAAKMKFTRQVIMEAMRLYPPLGFLSRTAAAPDVLCDTEIRKGDTMLLPIYALHRSSLYWKAPNQFRPSRFWDMSKIEKFTYLPFGAGPRVCLGMDFGMTEAIIILSTILSRVKVSLIPGREPKPVLVLTLRSENGFWLNVEPV